MVEHYEEWGDDTYDTFVRISELLTYLSFFSPDDAKVKDVTQSYVDYSPDVYGWDKRLVVLEWEVYGEPKTVVVPTGTTLSLAKRTGQFVFPTGPFFK
jgi:hypothetical protein